MDAPQELPLVFANRVVRQFIDHLVGADVPSTDQDLRVIRLIFRKGGGTWQDIFQGNIVHLIFLERIVTHWGKQQRKSNA